MTTLDYTARIMHQEPPDASEGRPTPIEFNVAGLCHPSDASCTTRMTIRHARASRFCISLALRVISISSDSEDN